MDKGALLVEALRKLPVESRQLSMVRCSGGWQANCLIDGGYRVDIRADPVDALLVAIGAVKPYDMPAEEDDGLDAMSLV